MSKKLKFIEYSFLDKNKVPIKEENEFDSQIGNSIIRSSVVDDEDLDQLYSKNIYNIDNILDSIYNESKIDEKVIDLDDVIVYDDFDMENSDQDLYYVYQCPICFSVMISFCNKMEICPFCENVKFPPEIIGLLNKNQIEEIDLDQYTIYNEDGIENYK